MKEQCWYARKKEVISDTGAWTYFGRKRFIGMEWSSDLFSSSKDESSVNKNGNPSANPETEKTHHNVSVKNVQQPL